jgi:hypothetical protein
MPAQAGTQATFQRGLGALQKLCDPKRISDLGPRLRGDDGVGVEAFKNTALGFNKSEVGRRQG